MSYIIAFVQMQNTEGDYPVECLRTDIQSGDAVMVRLHDQRLRHATVLRTAYLNWDCKGRIECLMSEAIRDVDGSFLPPTDAPKVVGLSTMDAIVAHLRQHGWSPLRPNSKAYRYGLTHSNTTQTANIFFRKNGVDLQLLPERQKVRPAPFARTVVSLAEGRCVKHFLSQTTFNLYEGIARFSQAFLANTNDYDRFFKSVGSSDRASSTVSNRIAMANNGEDAGDLRSALRGCEDGSGRIYLSDGVYL